MSIYQIYILPRLLNFVLQGERYDKERKSVAGQAQGVVLEIGAGSGPNIPFYLNITKLYALEPSKELWALAQERVKQASFPIEYVETSAEELPFPDQAIDTVVSTWTLCSIPHPEQALREVRRVLKPGGKFVFIEHGKSSQAHIAKWQTCCTPIWRTYTGGCHLDRNIEDLLVGAGFTLVKLEKGYKQNSRFKLLHYFYNGVGVRQQ